MSAAQGAGPGRDDTLAAALTRLGDPGAWALTRADGTDLSRGELLDAARAAAVRHRPGEAVPVRGATADAVVDLLAAQLAGATPVVAAPHWGSADLERVAALLARRRRPGSGDPADAAEPVLVLLTSGSSGRPRAVLRSCHSWAASLGPFSAVTGLDDAVEPVVWAPGAPGASLTVFAVWHALATGVPVVTGDLPVRRPPPHAERVGLVHTVPTVLADLLPLVERGDLPSLRTAVVAGARLPGSLRDRFAAAGPAVVEYYGAAELSFVAVTGDDGRLRAFPGVEVAVRDGRVVARSPYLAEGYLDPDDPGPLHRDADGWAGVGDLGDVAPDGALTVVGRGDAAVSVGGATVPVDDVERALRDVPGVRELVCLGVPDPRLGQLLVAVVEPQPGTDPRPELRRAARELLPRTARPVRWVLAELPRTPGGKVARAAVAALAARPGPGAPG